MTVQPIRVLLIEDNPADAELVHRALLKEANPPFEVEQVNRLQLGLERLTKGGIDVVLLDLGLPDSQELKGLSTIQNQMPRIPMVVLTGTYLDDGMAMEAVKLGAQDFLTKDRLNGWVLSRVLRYAIERKQAQTALQAINEELKMRIEHGAWLNQIMMDREKVIHELKQEVDALLKDLGKAPKYRI